MKKTAFLLACLLVPSFAFAQVSHSAYVNKHNASVKYPHSTPVQMREVPPIEVELPVHKGG